MKFVFIILLVGIVSVANSQNIVHVTVTDAKTGTPVEYAHVRLRPLPKGKERFQITGPQGIANFDVTGPAELTVSFLGYETFHDTISGKKDVAVSLNPTSVSIGDVVVTGHAGPVKADKSIYNVKVLDLKKEEGKAAIDLYQMLSTQSNMRLQEERHVGGQMSMQGLSGEYVKILVDGVPVTGRLDGNIDITQINMNDVDHIEIVEGPLSVIYGSGALAGTINVITKEQGKDGTSFSANLYGESAALANGNLTVMHKKKHNSFGFSGMGYYFNGLSNTDTLYRADQWKPKTKCSASGYYKYTKKDLNLKASSTYFSENILDRGEPFGDRNQNAFDHNYITNRWDVMTEGSHSISDRYKVDVLLAYNYYERLNRKTYLDFDDITSTETGTDSTRFDQITSRMIYSARNHHKLNWSAGYDILWEKYSGDRVLGSAKSIGDYALFATLNYTPVEKLHIQPGVRAMYNTDYKAPLVYSVNLLYSPVSMWQNRFSFGKGFKSPDLKQLYLDFHLSNLSITGNPDLDAENSYNMNFYSTLKVSKFRSLFTISAKGFYNKIDNKIELVSISSDQMAYTYVNINKIKTAGYGLDFSYSRHPRYSLTVSWTTTGLWNNFGDEYDSPDKFTWFTDFSSTFNYGFPRQGINLSVNYKFNGKAPEYILEDKTVGLFERESYNMMDLSAAKSFYRNRFKVMAGVKNLFDVTEVKQTLNGQEYVSMRGSNIIAYGRSFFMKISYAL